MEFVIWMSIAGFINFVMLKTKLDQKRYADFSLDFLVMVVLAFLFFGTLSGMAIALTTSSLFSIWLYFYPPAFMSGFDLEQLTKDLTVK